MSDPYLETSDRETAFESHESDAENLYDAIEILKESKGQYLIKWDGVDSNGRPWPDSWANKRDCTDDMVAAWKLKKAEKKKKAQERKANKKLTRTRNSAVSKVSEGSKASTSRQGTSAAPSARSLRSRTAVPADPQYDSEREYDSISRTPGNMRKRRLSRSPILSAEDDPPSVRMAKKPRLEASVETSPARPRREHSRGPPPYPPKKRSALQSDDEMVTAVRPSGKGKEVDRSSKSTATARGRPAKNTSLIQRQRDTFLEDEYDDFGDETPMKKPTRSPLLATPVSGPRFSLDRPAPLPLTAQSNILSPGGQARLDRFDDELARPTQPQQSQKTPLFYPASSEERDFLRRSRSHSLSPTRQSRSRSRSRSPTASDDGTPPSRSPSPAQRVPSPVMSDYMNAPSPQRSPFPTQRLLSPAASDSTQAPSPPPQPALKRHISARRAVEDSYRVGDVPETQSSPESPSPPPPPAASPKKSLISKMKPRFKASTAVSLISSPAAMNAGGREIGPIPMITAMQFVARLREGLDGGEDADVEDVEELMSSIEQFSSPLKGSGKKSRRLPDAKDKGKGRQREAVVEEEDEDSAHDRMLARGVEMAEAAQAERRTQKAAYARPQSTLSQILKARMHEGEGMSMSLTESDIPMPTGNGAGRLRYNLEDLRQEEEENTQDVMAYYQTADGASADVGRSDVERTANGNGAAGPSDAEESVDGGGDRLYDQNRDGGEVEDRSEGEDSADGAGDRSEDGERNGDEAGARSEAQDSAGGVSEDRDTDIDRSLDLDGPERSAWNEEHASQLLQQTPAHSSHSMESLMYPPDEELMPEVPPAPVTNGHIAQLPKSKSRSTSAPRKPIDEDLELPPTASTRHNTPEASSIPAEVSADPRHLDAAMSLLNVKSNENHRLEALLAEERRLLAAERAKNVVLQERVDTLELQTPLSTNNSDLETRLKLAEELLAAALQSNASAETERDAARRDQASAESQREVFREYYGKASAFAEEKASENRELEKRVKIAEEATKEGLATIKATFDLREVTLKSETRDWRNQANFLREQAIRTNDPELRRRAAEHPELVRKYSQLVDQNDDLKERLQYSEEDLLVKQDEIDRLEGRLTETTEELENLKAGNLAVDGDFQVLRCGWRSEATNAPCPALCRTKEDLDLHASMHVNKALVDPFLHFGVQ
ncbi:hypothetical protein DFH09DRAFT_54629 [Mycena vulgaris]|nr:hypothetical protein DFH09DRAFT_54629 [Mycena vulgaris]